MPRVPSAAAKHVGSQIKEARLRAAVSQDALASAAGIDQANMRAYENGRALPNLLTLTRIADALKMPPGKLLDGLTLAHFDGIAHSRRAS